MHKIVLSKKPAFKQGNISHDVLVISSGFENTIVLVLPDYVGSSADEMLEQFEELFTSVGVETDVK